MKPIRERVDYREFYNDAIDKEVNLSDHFDVWILEREKCKVKKV